MNERVDYTPDAWVLMKTLDSVKILAGWRGGYLNGDKWRLSSGVCNIEDKNTYWLITNHSGSIYCCFKQLEGMISIMAGMYETLTANDCTEIKIADYDHNGQGSKK